VRAEEGALSPPTRDDDGSGTPREKAACARDLLHQDCLDAARRGISGSPRG
jgi:hypothetical protein